MDQRHAMVKRLRRILGLLLVVAGLSTTWAWGRAARLAEVPPVNEQPPAALYAAWSDGGGGQVDLFQSTDEGATWQPLSLPAGGMPLVWADNGQMHLAVVTADGSLLLSEDQGQSWISVEIGLDILCLAWGDGESLYLGTNDAGVYQLAAGDALLASPMMRGELASEQIVSMALVEGRLFAATPDALLHTDDIGHSADSFAWTRSAPLPDLVTVVAATDKRTPYVGTATTGVYRSTDAGQTWQPAREGLGLAAGQMVRVTALRADPSGSGILYVAVEHMVGSTHVHSSAAGLFATLDGGASWQPLAGPRFPEAQHVSSLVLVPGHPLLVQAITAGGLQGYAPDVMSTLAALESDDPRIRASAARQLGIIRPQGAWNQLLAALDDPELAVSLAAADALGRIDDSAAVPGLMIAVEHPSEQIRLGAARALGLMRVQASVKPLQFMFLSGDGLESSVAGEALGRIGGPEATETLLAALADSQTTARWHVALAALEKMGEPAVAPLVAMLNSHDAYARRNAAQALGWIGSTSATDPLMRALKKDGEATVRAQAAWALGEIGDPAARRGLERAQRHDPAQEVQIEAGRALAYLSPQAQVLAGRAARWASLLDQLQPVRWLVLVLSLVGAAWLALGTQSLVAAPQRLRHR
jgi:HEAT repeat protein